METTSRVRKPLVERLALVDPIERRYRVARRSDLLDAAVQSREITQLVRSGLITRIGHGWYHLGSTPPPLASAVVATRAYAGAVLSHETAAHLHGLEVALPVVPIVTLPPGRTSGGVAAQIHRSPIDPRDRTRRSGLPVTSVGRTLVDLCATDTVDVEAIFDDALVRRLCRPSDVRKALERAEPDGPGRGGGAQVRGLLEPWELTLGAESVAEVRVVRLLTAHVGLPPRLQVDVFDEAGHFVARVDLAYPDAKVAIEYDGARFHGPRRWDHDEERARRLEQLGWWVLTIGAEQLRTDRLGWLDTVRTAVAQRTPA